MSKQLVIILLAIAAITSACKSKKGVVNSQGEVEMMSPKQLSKALNEKTVPPTWVKMLASVAITQNGGTQNANADIRMRQDSIFWVELSDKIIGIKAAKAFAMADTVAFFNRIERTYFAGSYNYVEKKLGTSLPFPYIFQVFQGQLFMGDAEISTVNDRYILIDKDAAGNNFTAELEPRNLDCVRQEFVTATDIMKIYYSDYREVSGYRFPYKIKVEVLGRQNLSATFDVTEIECNGPYKVAFSIGNNYERIE